MMRTLVIQRRKSSFAGLLNMYVYIEDHDNPTTKIAGTPCRMIGKLQNGDTEVLDIPESACRIFVVARKPFGYLSSEVLSLPEGSETIYLTGQNRFDFFTGSPFRFDHIVNEETIRHRTRNTRGGLWVVLAALFLGLLIGIGLGCLAVYQSKQPQVYTKDGFSITLPPNFYELDDDLYDHFSVAEYFNGTAEIAVIKESRYVLNIYSLIQYANAVEKLMAESEEDDFTIIQSVTPANGKFYIEMTYSIEGVDYHAVMFFYMSPSTKPASDTWYYRMIVAAPEEEFESIREEIFTWADSVEVE